MLSESDKAVWTAWVSKYMKSNINVRPLWNKNKADSISTRLDLHGYTVHDAFHAVAEFVEQHQSLKTKKLVIVTGKSGIISREFKHWLVGFKCVNRVEPMQDSRGGIGSYKIWIN